MLRPATAADGDFLCQMVALAEDWEPGSSVRSVASVLAAPDLAHYAVGWPGVGERGFVAETADGRSVGAAWWRFFAEDDHGYGFVREGVPEVSLAVLATHRGQGVDFTLMHTLVAEARTEGLAALSLSVEPDNFAARLYADLGFETVGATGGAVTMVLRLDHAEAVR